MGHDKSAGTKEMSSDARKEEKRAHKKRKRGADGERERKSKSRRVTDDEEEVALSTAAPFKLQSNRSSDAAAESSYALENEITVHMPPSSKPLYPVMDFNQLDIAETLQPSLKTFARPTPIQAYTWPALVENYDVVGVAETGRFVVRYRTQTER
jgi:ATP-dependent RNA helicase DBP3